MESITERSGIQRDAGSNISAVMKLMDGYVDHRSPCAVFQYPCWFLVLVLSASVYSIKHTLRSADISRFSFVLEVHISDPIALSERHSAAEQAAERDAVSMQRFEELKRFIQGFV